MNIILASNSPRRKELLKLLYDDFSIIPANIDETVPNGIPLEKSAEYIAIQKTIAISKNHQDSLVIGCDTMVIIDDTILGKPKDKSNCFDMLKQLSGKIHSVITGVCVILGDKKVTFSEETKVKFYNLSDEEIWKYIATGEPFDKAGGYGIQGYGSLLVEKINGDYFNIVGLPISRLNQTLKNFLP
ncbi:MAG: Maf family protein [Oscillospiraceae bacterium]